MKKLIALLMALLMCLALCACGSSSDKYIGTWECTDNNGNTRWDVHDKIELYMGGTGKLQLIDKQEADGIRTLSISWEEKDGVMNLIYAFFGDVEKEGFVLKNNILTSVDGKYEFKKAE